MGAVASCSIAACLRPPNTPPDRASPAAISTVQCGFSNTVVQILNTMGVP